jgi:hypothetical protein
MRIGEIVREGERELPSWEPQREPPPTEPMPAAPPSEPTKVDRTGMVGCLIPMTGRTAAAEQVRRGEWRGYWERPGHAQPS